MGSNQIPVHQSSLCPRSPELRSGLALETESGGLGMESTPQVVNLVWQRFGQVEVDLFVLSMTTHCLLWFSLSSPLPLCLDTLSHRWPRTSLYVFHNFTSSAGFMEAMGVAPEWNALMCSGLSTETTNTIINSRAHPTRRLFAFKCRLFASWCRPVDPNLFFMAPP